MAAFTFTQTDYVIGTLTNGMKVVSTTVTFTSTGATTATPVTVKPLRKIIHFLPAGTKTTGSGGIVAWALSTTTQNIINGTPAASNNAGVVELISFGY